MKIKDLEKLSTEAKERVRQEQKKREQEKEAQKETENRESTEIAENSIIEQLLFDKLERVATSGKKSITVTAKSVRKVLRTPDCVNPYYEDEEYCPSFFYQYRTGKLDSFLQKLREKGFYVENIIDNDSKLTVRISW
jgi:gamma-glutamyl phosphate reductase